MSNGCRPGAQLHGASVCREQLLTDDESRDLGVGIGRWCREHGEYLADIQRRLFGRSGPPAGARCLRSSCSQLRAKGSVFCKRCIAADEADTGVVTPQPAFDSETVARIVAAVTAAGSISGPALAERLGTAADSRLFKTALKQAVASAQVEVRSAGYVPAGTPEITAADLVAAVGAAPGIGRNDLAAKLNTKYHRTDFQRALKQAVSDGDVISKLGPNGGYFPQADAGALAA